MGRKKIPGLQKRYGVWHIDKKIFGQRVCESTGTGSLEEAEKVLARKIEEIRNTKYFGIRPKRTFKEAATRYLNEYQHKASISDDAGRLRFLVPYIGDLYLENIHMGTLQIFIDARRNNKVKSATINHGLKVVRRILNLAATEWIDENNLTWLHSAPKIKMLKTMDNKEPYPLSWEEQDRLFAKLPDHLNKMALFAVNTGCRDSEICNLKWSWEVDVGNDSVFVIPKEYVKNREHRLVVLNKIARSVIESVRRKHAEYVFTFKGKPIRRMLNSGWKKARIETGLLHVRVHDLKHTFGRRLRAAGVSFEDRQDLLGHKSTRITTHYSSAELSNLINAANLVCERNNCSAILRLAIQPIRKGSRESHAQGSGTVRKN
jgi:integrase